MVQGFHSLPVVDDLLLSLMLERGRAEIKL